MGKTVSSAKSRARGAAASHVDTTSDSCSDARQDRGKLACALAPEPRRSFAPGVGPSRMRAIIASDKKWVNGTALRYYFFSEKTDGEYVDLVDGSSQFISWVGNEQSLEIVREAFETWKSVGIGLSFTEVHEREEAEIRIGFMPGNGHWSYLGRDILKYKSGHRTMNFDGDLIGQYGADTALHEIGHTLGMYHAHQNPNSGIVWNEPEVLRYFAEPPNLWEDEVTRYNVLRKVPRSSVLGGAWDPNSIMQYRFDAGLIRFPERYQSGITPTPGLSEMDKAWVKAAYPPLDALDALVKLQRFHSMPAELSGSEHFNATFEPTETGLHRVSSFGETDLVLTVFEATPKGLQFLAGDDDSGEERNAQLVVRMVRGRRYMVRARLFYSRSGQGCTIMVH